MRLVKKIYKVEVYPEPYVYGVDACSRKEARDLIRMKYPDKVYKIVANTIRYTLKRKAKSALVKMKMDEVLD